MMPLIKTFEHLQIQLEAIKSATNNFDAANCIGSGGFGKVYKGELVHSKGKTMVALKRLDRIYGQGEVEFWNEVIMLSLYKHENIVSLLGFCDDSKEKILVYEYVSKGSLDLYLEKDDLTWGEVEFWNEVIMLSLYKHENIVSLLGFCDDSKEKILVYEYVSKGSLDLYLEKDDLTWDEINPNSLKAFASIAYQCLNRDRETRPLMTEIVRELEKALEYQDVQTHDHRQENCNIAYETSTDFHFKRARRERFGLEELLGAAKVEALGGSSLGTSYKSVLLKGPVVAVKRFKPAVIKEGIKVDFHAHMMLLESMSHPNFLPSVACYYSEKEKLLITDFAVNGSMASHLHVKPKDAYETSTDFHFKRARRERFGLEELLGAAKVEALGGSSLGTSYKSVLLKGPVVAVKRFKPAVIKEGIKVDFHAHMMLLESMSHPNLLPSVACYYSEKEKLLITDFAVNGSMASHLHVKPKDGEPGLDWPTRLNIIKADYALAPIIEKEAAKAYMKAYKSPEFTKHKQRVTKKTDVWCLGILILETLTGKSPLNYLEEGKSTTEQEFVTWVNSIGREEWTNKVFDKGMKWGKNNEIEMIDLMEIGLHCCESDVSRRWDMRKVYEKIQGLRETENEEEYLSDSSEW
ncbi:leucine-rich repeat protein kinase family protein [Artemisia annua]|uniref:Leucine-rich repeat protein kinase family protein n=1 Tax=Artemisia annua TaxID=35608 RepID=A0A2U1NAW8_ARTAN|nr:leucine-rich repeat protein kinase family protein [Artemisia annua]